MGLRPRDWGELLVTAAVGLVLLTPVATGYVRGNAEAKRHTLVMAMLLALLVFFGVFIDMVHIWLGSDPWGLLEDGGEMIAVSLVLYYVFRHLFDMPAAIAETSWKGAEVRQELQSA